MNFIKLTRIEHNYTHPEDPPSLYLQWVNVDRVLSFGQAQFSNNHGAKGFIQYDGGNSFSTVESPEEIMVLMGAE